MQDKISIIEQLLRSSAPVNEAVAAIHSLAGCGTSAAIAPMIELLSYHHAAVRAAAVDGLVKLAPDSVEPLIAAYEASKDQGLQAHIIQALAQIGDARAFELLAVVVGVEVANHCQGNVRRVAARGLGKIATSSSNNPQIIHNVVEKLAWALLNAEDWALRYAAVVSLGEIGIPEALALLQQALNQEQDKVVQARIKTLGLTHHNVITSLR